MASLPLFQLGQRGVNLVTAATHLTPDELTSGQNAESVPQLGDGAIDQRPGMTKVNASAINSGAGVVLVHDVPSQRLADLTPTLVAGLYNTASHNWRQTTDGITWTYNDTMTKPWTNDTDIVLDAKRFPKCVTVGRYLYWFDSASPMQLHRWDGTTDLVVSTIPPAVSGVSLSTPSAPAVQDNGGSVGTATYKVVAIAGSSHSAASAATSVAHDSNNWITPVSPPVTGATAYDLYRTAGGGSQGKIGTIPIVAGAFTTGNGSPGVAGVVYADTADPGDASTAPTTASGSNAGAAIGVLDMITDGNNIYICALDLASGDDSGGRILAFNPMNQVWTTLLTEFPITADRGTAGSLGMVDGDVTFGSYIGLDTGNSCTVMSTNYLAAAGGVPENHATASDIVPTAIQQFAGSTFVTTASIFATTASLVLKRTADATWSTSLTHPGAAPAQNAFTSMAVYNGLLVVGIIAGSGANSANIRTTPDGINWTLEVTLQASEVPCQMVVFNGKLYVVTGRIGVGYNTLSRIYQRDTAGTWTTVDDTTNEYAGCLGIVYV